METAGTCCRHSGEGKGEILPAARRIVLAGNPNVGKSLFFGSLTGLYAEVSNYPGTTVEISRGRMGEADLLDTPGIYGVSSFNDEEKVARDIILAADVILNVVDATHLERDLFLTRQLIDMGTRAWFFMKAAAPWFVFGSLAVAALCPRCLEVIPQAAGCTGCGRCRPRL